jgi:lipoprotein NlpD
VAQQTPVPGSTSATPGSYTVKRGDTLYSIALEHGVDYRELASSNNIDDPSKLRIGQVLRIVHEQKPPVQVGAARGSSPVEARPLDAGAPAPAAASGDAMKSEPKAVRLPYSEQNVALLQKGEPPKPAAAQKPEAVARAEPKPEPPKPASAAAPADPDAIEFIWPHRGRMIQGFAEPNSKGVDIAGKPGDPVLAAAAGRVMYTGTGIRGYGKLIVIKHDNNFNSVYAHNREILVKEGQTVTRGQKIAELGDSDADTPKLHFEIRQSGKPVDPLRYLPRS